MDMNHEFQDNFAAIHHNNNLNLETDLFDTEEPVMTTLDENNQKPSGGSKKKAYKLYTFFVLVLCLDLLIGFDHGVLPAAAISIQSDLGLNYV